MSCSRCSSVSMQHLRLRMRISQLDSPPVLSNSVILERIELNGTWDTGLYAWVKAAIWVRNQANRPKTNTCSRPIAMGMIVREREICAVRALKEKLIIFGSEPEICGWILVGCSGREIDVFCVSWSLEQSFLGTASYSTRRKWRIVFLKTPIFFFWGGGELRNEYWKISGSSLD